MNNTFSSMSDNAMKTARRYTKPVETGLEALLCPHDSHSNYQCLWGFPGCASGKEPVSRAALGITDKMEAWPQPSPHLAGTVPG